jgi:recombination protein RecT
MANQTIAAHEAAQIQQGNGNQAVGTDGPAFAILRQYWPQLRHLLPSHVKPEAWYAAVYAALFKGVNRSNRDQLDLMTCANSNPESLMFALFDAARQGLEPGTEQYYLTPRPNKNAKGGREVLGIRGYQGEIELIYRAGAVAAVIVDCVRRNDDYRYQRGVDQLPIHRFDPWAKKEDRGELIGVYAYCLMKDGAISRVVELNRDDIDRAKRSSPTANADRSPWKTDEEAMWLKTAIHRVQKFVPTSAEYLHVQPAIAKLAETPQSVIAAPDNQSISPLTQAAISAAPSGVGPPEPPLNPAVFAQPPAPEDSPLHDDPAVESISSGSSAAATEARPASTAQHRAIMRLLGGLVTGDPHRHAVYSRVLGRAVGSGKDLTVSDASTLIEALNAWQRAGELEASIAAITPEGASSTGSSSDVDALWQRVMLAVPEEWTTQDVESKLWDVTGVSDPGKATAADLQQLLDHVSALAVASPKK